MKRPVKLSFIINPASGGNTSKPGGDYILNFFDKGEYELTVAESKGIGHAAELAAASVQNGADAVIAVGGDGTVNEIARSLNRTGCALGIIPCGSGNGLARHHKISLRIPEALKTIKRFNVINHDATSINGSLSFNVSGIGFDAHVANLFGKNGKRGFSSYVKLVFREFAAYREQEICIRSDQGETKQPIMLAAIATASQFGNNAIIAPYANTNDGSCNLTLVRKMSGLQLPWFMYQVFTKNVGRSGYASLMAGEKFIIDCATEMPLHLDGEPAGYHKRFKINTMKGTLKIIVP